MIKRKLKKCKSCGFNKYLFSRGLCQQCWAKAHGTKTVAKKDKERRRATKVQRTRVQSDEPKQSDIFNEIWNERDHVSEISGERLLPKGHPLWHWQFMHILPKGLYSNFKLYKPNILLGTVDEHIVQTRKEHLLYDHKNDIILQEKWKGFYERRRQLLTEYFK